MMKHHLLFAAVILGALCTGATAETLYVTDEVTITLRTGPSLEHKVIATLKSGQETEVVNPGAQWSEIRLPDGRQGWVLTRYLAAKIPDIVELEKIRKQHETLLSKLENLAQEHKSLLEENKRLSADLGDKQKALDEVGKAYETLKTESSEFLKLKADSQATAKKLAEQTEKVDRLDQELTRMQTGQIFRWVLTGAGILLLGFILGYSSRTQRKRSSLL